MPQIYVSGLSKVCFVIFFYTQNTNRLSLDAYVCVVVRVKSCLCSCSCISINFTARFLFLCFLIENKLNLFLAIFRLAFHARCFSTPCMVCVCNIYYLAARSKSL